MTTAAPARKLMNLPGPAGPDKPAEPSGLIGSTPTERRPKVAPRKNSKTTADVTITFAEGTCRSGSGNPTKAGRTYAQGGDAKLHSILAKALRDGATTVQFNDEPVITIEAEYANHGWTIPVPKPKKAKTVKDEPTDAQSEPVEDEALAS